LLRRKLNGKARFDDAKKEFLLGVGMEYMVVVLKK